MPGRPAVADELPVDELPVGLPLFGVQLHVPELAAELQLFRVVRTVVTPRCSLHALLVHPEQVAEHPELAAADAFLQLHGQVWTVRAGPATVAISRLGGTGDGYVVDRVGDAVRALRSGTVLAAEPAALFAADDEAKVRLLGACFLDAYDDDALSVPLVRGYPGRTSLIRTYREYPLALAGEPAPRTAPARWLWDPVAGRA